MMQNVRNSIIRLTRIMNDYPTGRFFVHILMAAGCLAPGNITAQQNQLDISQRGYAWSDYNIVQNEAGYVVAVWYDERNADYFEGEELAGAIYGRILDPQLNPMGSDFRISEQIPNGLTRQPDVILLNNGSYVVVWTESVWPEGSPGPYQRRIVMTMRSIDGELLIPETDVADNPEELSISSPSIYKLPGERFLVTWNVPSLRRYGQYYFMDGTPDGGNVSMIHPELNLFASGVQVANDELYFMSYIEQPREARWIQYYDISHSPVGNPIRLEQRGRITPFGADSILVEYISEGLNEIYIQFLSPDGTIRSEPILVNDDGGIQPKLAPKIARNPGDGSYVVVWEDGRNGLPTSSFTVRDIYAQRFDGQGRPVGGNFKVNHEERENSQMLPDILYRGDHHYLITWLNSQLICPPKPPPGAIIGNVRDSYITATVLDYEQPDPGPVFGWAYGVSQCEGVKAFELKQNYPNPFNHSTNLVIHVNSFLGPGMDMHIEIYDVLGRKVREFHESSLRGTHEIPFDAGGLASGLFIVRATSPQVRGLTQTMTMMLVK
jgi:hypothetical protein